MANTLTQSIKVHSFSDVNIHSNWLVRLESMTMLYGVKRMVFGTLAIFDVKDLFAKVKESMRTSM